LLHRHRRQKASSLSVFSPGPLGAGPSEKTV
jgi:hypothetical protein